MKSNSIVKKMVITSMCLALCVVIPFAFHMIPNSATIFCPIHIPILICAMVCGIQYGIACAVVGPTLCMLVTGMPNAIALPSLIVECVIYSLVSGLLMIVVKTKHLYADLYISLIVAMILGRIAGGVFNAFVIGMNSYDIKIWAVAYFVKGWPGIVIQLLLIPNLIFALMKAKVIEERYKKEEEQEKIFVEYSN